MNENLKWGGAGLLLALAGSGFVASEIQHGIEVGNPLPIAYGAAVVIATLVAVLLIAPSFRTAS
ncbi:hypothetical protein EGH24_02445 [Halonotius terrestris]|uniref:Uncharacterized protein n=1 Tax=Halonotius terrestris TaxID=2487750 RepID=A0A8J8TDM6_9EURY|nr:hypothetical protein [Halonotius terrestris]TQQ83666.1 hypothetical protein EGH24_02445 [Halonotius terrestris]